MDFVLSPEILEIPFIVTGQRIKQGEDAYLFEVVRNPQLTQ